MKKNQNNNELTNNQKILKNMQNFENKNETNLAENTDFDIEKSSNENDLSLIIEEKNIEEISENLTKISLEKSKEEVSSEQIEEVEFSNEIAEEKIKQALESQSPKKRKKSIILSIILLIFNLVFMFFIVKNLVADVEDFNISSLIEKQGVKLWWLLGGIFVYAIFIFVQVVAFKILIKNLSGKNSWKIAYDLAVIGKYYDNVTPFAVGGQPMQIATLAKNKFGAGVSTSIPLIKMIINTGMSAFVAIIFFIFGFPLLSTSSALNQFLLVLLEIIAIIGIIVTVLLALFMLLLSSGVLFTRSFISGILRFGYKVKLVKDYRKTYRKVLNQVAEYKFSMKYLWNNKKILLSLLLLGFSEYLAIASSTFFVTLALSSNINTNIFLLLFISITKYNLCQMASCYIPLPGGTGLIEISFIIMFGSVLGDNIVWGLLAWRFFSYYLIIINGFVHELTKIIKNIIKNKREGISLSSKNLQTNENLLNENEISGK